jgi:hypothetical protein
MVEWSLGGHLSELCPMTPTANQDGHLTKNRKFSKNNHLKIISSETAGLIGTKLWGNCL